GRAVEAVNVRTDASAIDLTAAVEPQHTDTDRILVSTAPGADGIVQRMDVRAREGNNTWAVFALANSGNEQIDRLIVIPHYRLVGSGLLWPDLGLSRVVAVTSSGERPERVESATADVFRVTLDPGAVMTYVAELRTGKLTQIYLWEPDAYKDKINSITLYHGIVIRIAGLLALFLTILFLVKGSIMFPAVAVLGFGLVVYLSLHGFDRAVMLIPTWLLLLVWVIAAGLAVTSYVTNDIVGPALLGGLVLIVMLIGFTVMQHAFAGGVTHNIVTDMERRPRALTGAGDMIWDWDVSADKVFTSPETETLLGLKRGALEGPAGRWLDVLHPLDRD